MKSEADVLDLPAGTGRHSELLGSMGHRVTVADIDEILVRDTVERLTATGVVCRGAVVDATGPLPFPKLSFDLVLVVDFVSSALLSSVHELIRPGGYLIYESYSARGENWRQLLPPGQTKLALGPSMEIVDGAFKPVGPAKSGTELVKISAVKRALED